MVGRRADKERKRQQLAIEEERRRRAEQARKLSIRITGAVALAVVVLGVIFVLNNSGGSSAQKGKAGEFKFQVGSPGPGQEAPPIQLTSTSGQTLDSASLRGKTVLLYFQEGIGCQPCWDQLKDIEAQFTKFRRLGIDRIVTVTTDSLDQLHQKVSDEGLSTPVLSDSDLAVSKAYSANQYGMMGASRDGHSFIVVGPDGRIKWRADYGGPPDFTMFVPVSNLLADIRKGLTSESQA